MEREGLMSLCMCKTFMYVFDLTEGLCRSTILWRVVTMTEPYHNNQAQARTPPTTAGLFDSKRVNAEPTS